MMRYIAPLLISLMSSIASAGWVSGTIHVRDDNAKTPILIFVNSSDNGVARGPLSAVWNDIDVTAFGIPSTAKSVFLSGILIITHGTTPGYCDMSLLFRAPGDLMGADNYIAQVFEPWLGGGQRSTMASWAPIKNGITQFQWNRSTQGFWKENCSYGINLTAQAYVE